MRLKLNQSIPWSDEETGGFAISALLSSCLFSSLVWGLEGLILNRFVMGILMLFGIGLLNTPPVKRLPGFVQYLVCCGVAGLLNALTDKYASGMSVFLSGVAGGFAAFCVLRVNWWFWWDYPTRRTIGQRIAASIFFTGIPFLGLGMAVWRLVFGIGQHDVTTQFVVDPAAPGAKPLETIIEDPALEEHARRMTAIRAGQAGTGSGRMPAESKAETSESI
jgi:hypothetical protein